MQQPGVTEVRIECTSGADPAPQTALFRLLSAMNAPLLLLVPEQDTLEEVFLRATSGE